ncbi:OapA family protein [Methylophaga sp. OBS3]|uniref:OapA family protein n=1 Tax=Methylophaga sp. OBS3 TaxID=2991934 RepID=UPI00225BFBE0|nr:peptidoglycan DD-metalloendopeptidase family protein [Methylophaga sp. OBS3]MCX4189978.1 peptidoglycan DD-metalloendopeptidase family protein [Methylophaga sp. OBS3]
MKKRNRLLSPSQQTRIFKSERLAPHKNRHFMFVSVLAIAGIFLTTMVLATSAPAPTSQSQVIKLPEIKQEMHALASPITKSPAAAITPLTVQSKATDETPISDVEATEQLHLQTGGIPVESPENVALVAEPRDSNVNWQEVEIVSGDNLSRIFPRLGLTATDVFHVAQTENIKPLLNLKPGQLLRVGLEPAEEDDSLNLIALELQLDPIKTLSLTAVDDGYIAETHEREIEKRQQVVGGEIQSSLFLDGQKAGMSDKLIMELAYIFGWDIDFALDLRQGDSFKVVYNENYLDGDKIDDGEILAAEFTNRGKSFRAVRFTDDEGTSRYYTPTGDSMRKAFTRTPVPISRISSGFNPNRKHPVLKTNRPHRGTDYAAATGTPILATGDGKVSFVGNKGGYGRTVILSHGGRYTTLFAHMSRYKSGIKVGQRVRQGDVIGYIGSSGLATGPHLHYEFRVDGVHKDPLTVELPKAEALPAQYRQQFAMLSEPLLARLDNVQIPTIAFNID